MSSEINSIKITIKNIKIKLVLVMLFIRVPVQVAFWILGWEQMLFFFFLTELEILKFLYIRSYQKGAKKGSIHHYK